MIIHLKILLVRRGLRSATKPKKQTKNTKDDGALSEQHAGYGETQQSQTRTHTWNSPSFAMICTTHRVFFSWSQEIQTLWNIKKCARLQIRNVNVYLRFILKKNAASIDEWRWIIRPHFQEQTTACTGFILAQKGEPIAAQWIYTSCRKPFRTQTRCQSNRIQGSAHLIAKTNASKHNFDTTKSRRSAFTLESGLFFLSKPDQFKKPPSCFH